MNGENLIYIYGVFNDKNQKEFLAKLAKSLKNTSNEVWIEGEPSSDTNRLSRVVNLWACVVIIVCSDQYFALVEKEEQSEINEVVLSRKVLAENYDMNKLIICLRDNPSKRIPSFLSEVPQFDFTDNANDDAKILDLKNSIDKKLNQI